MTLSEEVDQSLADHSEVTFPEPISLGAARREAQDLAELDLVQFLLGRRGEA